MQSNRVESGARRGVVRRRGMREGLGRFTQVDTGGDNIQKVACCRIEAVRRDRVSSAWSVMARSLRENVLGVLSPS